MDTPELPVRPKMSGRVSGSSPYSVVESNAVDSRVASWPRGEIVEAPVGALRRALAREHARRIFFLAPVRIDAAGVGIARPADSRSAGNAGSRPSPSNSRRRELRDRVVAQRFGVVIAAQLAAAHRVRVLGRADALLALRPAAQRGQRFGADLLERAVVGGAQRIERRRSAGCLGARASAAPAARHRPAPAATDTGPAPAARRPHAVSAGRAPRGPRWRFRRDNATRAAGTSGSRERNFDGRDRERRSVALRPAARAAFAIERARTARGTAGSRPDR